ncbi:MAG: S8/S53 family peptidase [Propionicimonas sp.]|uniref:S8/S53 family peptidase n=1 Tax=Propionicimonas sp. TaxID=1955623 RepID=UPI003D14029A
MIRVLDPTTAVVRPGQEVGATAYVSDRLLVRNSELWERDPRVDKALAELGWGLHVPEKYGEKGVPRREPRSSGFDRESTQVAGLDLRIITDAPTLAPDAWTALQQIRTAAPEAAVSYELVHVMVAADTWSGVGKGGTYIPGIGKGGTYIPGIGKGGTYIPGIGLGPDEFGMPGYGGKAPVALIVADPSKTAPRLTRPPVVVMPDTGIGRHPWFPDEAKVGINPAQPGSLGVRVFGDPVADREPGITARLTGQFDRLAGHGTFIAGIVRQACPAARLTSYAVMSSEGLVAEDDALDVLQDVLDQQVAALAGGHADAIVDVVTLSFGYYHEDLPDEDSDPSTLPPTSLGTLLRDLGRAGILVVAGAGNDGTSRPFLPAALAGDTGTGSGDLPLVSVGSLNPNRSTVSLFSNGGTWVTTYRHGAAIVSTLPRLQNASSQSSSDVAGVDTLTGAAKQAVEAGKAAAPADRSTIDMDDFSGGFGVWSGTSFSAPLLAGQLAQALVGEGTDAVDLDSLRTRGWSALATILRPLRRL